MTTDTQDTQAVFDAVSCPRRACSVYRGKPCKSRDGLPHDERLERFESFKQLDRILPPGSTVYTVLRHVSKSGMTRHIDCYAFKVSNDGKGVDKLYLSYHVAKLLGYPIADVWGRNEGIKVSGCGMDMGFSLVHSLSYALHGMRGKPEGIDDIGRPLPREEIGSDKFRAGYSLHHEWI